jgi:acetaldehyde dehydrogenase (acetylating)
MAKLISIIDIEKLIKTGEMACIVEQGTIITPSAKDLAQQHGIQLSTKDLAQQHSIQPSAKDLAQQHGIQLSAKASNEGHIEDTSSKTPAPLNNNSLLNKQGEKESTKTSVPLTEAPMEQSIQEARDIVSWGSIAAEQISSYTEEQIDRILYNMVEAAKQYNVEFAKLAVEETGFGNVADKTYKNHLATVLTYQAIKDIKTIGVIEKDVAKKITVIAEPMGLLMGIVPSTNPTSTTMFKSIIAVKARNSIVFSPHPSACKCTLAAAELMHKAAVEAGAPENIIGCLSKPSMQASEYMMKSEQVKLIIATGGPGLVKAAYSAGKPALGVGAGNTPTFIERSADIPKAVSDIIASKTFDNGTICASEQAIVVEECIRDAVITEFKRQGAYFMTGEETKKVCDAIFKGTHTMNAKLVGREATTIAKAAGISVPAATKVLIGEQFGVGEAYPLSYEKLTTVLGFYTVKDWEEACHLCVDLLQNGIGHTLSIHTRNEDIVEKFSVKPASRILINTGSSQGGTGASTGLLPSFTLGCGTWAGSSTSENVSPLHLINKKKVAYGIKDCLTLADSDPLFQYTISSDSNYSMTPGIVHDMTRLLSNGGGTGMSKQELNSIITDLIGVLKGGEP